ncbi:MAG TPA: hypothetical protein VHD56_11820 [Tepidisphaeraceae bacterium]|nr:hypothetical protein [Tepidisphaeraceae bacterium]
MYISQGANISGDIFAKTLTDAAGKFSASFVMPVEYNRPYLWLVCNGKPGLLWRSLPQASLHDLHLQYKPAVHLKGKVVDGDGHPVRQARITPSQLEDPDLGMFVFSRGVAQAAPFAESREDGSFELDGLPRGATVYFRARHDHYGAGTLMAVQNLSDNRTLDDIKMTDEIVIEGFVRKADTQQPIAGATVFLTENSGSSEDSRRDTDWHLNQTVTDADGHYRMGGLDSRNFINNAANLRVKLGEGEPPQIEGSLRYTKRLYTGDHVTLNLDVDRPLALREQEWRLQPGKPAVSHALVAVAEDADPNFKDKSAYADTLTVYDGAGTIHGQAGGLNQFSWADSHIIAASPRDGSIWLIETSGRRLLHYSREAKLLSEIKGTQYESLAIDPKTGNIWTLSDGGRAGTSTIHVLNPDGVEMTSYSAAGGDLAYSAHDDCFWIAGSQLSKVDRNGNTIAQGAVKVTYAASSLAVNDSDGSVWLTERSHPQMETSVDRLTIFESNGQVRKQVDGFDGAVVVDSSHGAGWAFSRRTSNPRLVKFDLNGNILQTIPLTGSSLAIEPDTGYLWVGGPAAIDRLDLEGNVVATIKSNQKTAKWIALIP